MIGKLKGIVDAIDKDFVIIDVNGVGYIVFCSAKTLGWLPQIGEAVSLIIETHVREDHIHLYGFKDVSEREWFRTLITVKGVGVKVALAILGVLNASQLSLSIAAKDKTMFKQVSGVGPKLAERIITELKDKFVATSDDFTPSVNVGAKVSNMAAADDIIGDAVSALTNLGYGRSEAYTIVRQQMAQNDKMNINELIKSSLKELAR
jgi:Holliday junction DNA helicase RuvA